MASVGPVNRLLKATARTTRRFVRQEDGATLIEYGMLVMLIAVLCLLAVKATGSKISNVFTQANSLLP